MINYQGYFTHDPGPMSSTYQLSLKYNEHMIVIIVNDNYDDLGAGGSGCDDQTET